jgi:predicted nucleic acid-binding protein
LVVTAASEPSAWLIDKSALVRLGRSSEAVAWASRIERGLVRIATVTLLEIGYSARDPQDLHAGLREAPVVSMPVEHTTPAAEDRAVEILTALADHGHHRAPSVPDLLVATIADRAGLVVLHHDKDFDLIAQITGQPTERLSD